MRLWTIHPRYLDARGLVALWREALLAQKVLKGATKGYTRHPQLQRFREQPDPLEAIAAYLRPVQEEAGRRGYTFDESKIARPGNAGRIRVTDGQLLYEWRRLSDKLMARSDAWYRQAALIETPRAHPLFEVVPGDVERWERQTGKA